MAALTPLLAAFFSFLVIVLPPIYAFLAFCCAIFTYPLRMTVPLGPADFSLGRIVVLPLLAAAIFRHKLLRNFKVNAMDFAVVGVWLFSTLAAYTTMPASTVTERQGGIFFDTIFTYLAARLIVRTKQDFMKFIKGAVIIASPLAIIGMIEALTGFNPYRKLLPYYGMGFAELADGLGGANREKRMGLFRATGSFNIHISWGLFFAALAPMAAGLWRQQKVMSRPKVVVFTGLMLMGLVSSASSAPLFAIVTAAIVIAAYPWRRFWPVLAILFLGSMVFVEVYSNRHFYHVFTRLALNGETAYYRIQLFEQTFNGGMRNHWLFGYGYVGVGPGTDNTNFNFQYKDLVNIYIYYLVRYGLVGLMPFIIMNVLFYRRIYQGAIIARNFADKWTIWCFAAAFIGWNVAMMTVGALAQTEIIMSMLIGIAANLPRMMALERFAEVPAREPVLEPKERPARVRGAPRQPWKSKYRQRVEAGAGAGAARRRHA